MELHKRTEDLTGQEFNGRRVMGFEGYGARGALWTTECIRCGETKSLKADKLKKYGCFICSQTNSCKYKHGKYISSTFFWEFERGAKRRGIEFNITIDHLDELWVKQKGRCALTDTELSPPVLHKNRSYNASLDRIDSKYGYVEGNVQFVTKQVNVAKGTMSQDEWVKLAHETVRKHPNR